MDCEINKILVFSQSILVWRFLKPFNFYYDNPRLDAAEHIIRSGSMLFALNKEHSNNKKTPSYCKQTGPKSSGKRVHSR